ncbi:MAG TPA: hypothetical protein VHH53_07290, partial [Pseudonocardiaceae bacterium]|nr:hypothetical protein [Pseudonocardiaceae bacterium]
HSWAKDTISVADIREIGGLPANTAVIEENLRDGTERTLGEEETAASGQTLGRARCRPSGSTSAQLDRVRWGPSCYPT